MDSYKNAGPRQGPLGILAEPDVWWGESGIDALLWADPAPYGPPATEVPVRSALARAGDA